MKSKALHLLLVNRDSQLKGNSLLRYAYQIIKQVDLIGKTELLT